MLFAYLDIAKVSFHSVPNFTMFDSLFLKKFNNCSFYNCTMYFVYFHNTSDQIHKCMKIKTVLNKFLNRKQLIVVAMTTSVKIVCWYLKKVSFILYCLVYCPSYNINKDYLTNFIVHPDVQVYLLTIYSLKKH